MNDEKLKKKIEDLDLFVKKMGSDPALMKSLEARSRELSTLTPDDLRKQFTI